MPQVDGTAPRPCLSVAFKPGARIVSLVPMARYEPSASADRATRAHR